MITAEFNYLAYCGYLLQTKAKSKKKMMMQ